ncbi:3199_t:CDS:2, partial [Cetraspora pellucida]
YTVLPELTLLLEPDNIVNAMEPADIESATDYSFLLGLLQDSTLKLPLKLVEINSLSNFSLPLVKSIF